MTVKDIIILGCSSQQHTRSRNHGAYLVRWNGDGLLFDPGEGTQRQFIFANVAPTVVNRIFISHFHGDHCLGLGSMLLRLNLDKVSHDVQCYYPASGKKYFDRLRFGCAYHQNISVVEHPVEKNGIVQEDDKFIIEAIFLKHGIENVGWRITEKDKLKFDKKKLDKFGVVGPKVKELQEKGKISVDGKTVTLEQVSWIQKGETIAVVIDTLYCEEAIEIAKDAKILICESTFLEDQKHLAKEYMHMTAKEAATIAKKANVEKLILTHFSARYQEADLFAEEAKPVFENVVVAEDLKRITF